MVQSASYFLTFEEFLEQYPNDNGRYELRDGVVFEVRPVGKHEEIAEFISVELTLEIRRQQLPYFVPKTCLVKPTRQNTGLIPDVIVLDRETIGADPLWASASTISLGQSARLAIEVVSTNWRDDYLQKLNDYEVIGIPEYWIVDYLALGAVRYIGSPKQPVLSIYQLIEGEYHLQQFRGTQPLMSSVFPNLNLTADQIFKTL